MSDVCLTADVPFREPSEPVVTFHKDGRIEFGEKYRNNPDAAAQEFMRIVVEQWPHLTNPTTGK